VSATPSTYVHPINNFQRVIFREIPAIQQILLNEIWLETERRGVRVYADDQVVRANVCQIVLRIGAELRASTELAIAANPNLLAFPEFPDAA